MSTLVDDLRAARALIADPMRWKRGAAPGPRGEMCALRAVATVSNFGEPSKSNWWTKMPGYVALEEALPTEGDHPHHSVGGFNDDPATTHSDVLALFDRAINAALAKVEA